MYWEKSPYRVTIHTHFEGDDYYANIVEKYYDAAGYDAFHAAASKILNIHLEKKSISINMVLQVLTRFGKRNGREYVKTYDIDNPDLTKKPAYMIVYHKPYDEFLSNHKKEFIDKIVENVKYTLGKELTKDEEQKLRRGLELAFEYGRRFYEIYKRVDEQKYHAIGKTSSRYIEAGFHSVQYAEKTLGVDFLEEVGDIILELNRLFPGFSKPEEVYGDRWYEFLKKKGIDQDELNPKKKIQKSQESLSAEAKKLLGILNGLKYAGYSKEAVGSAVNDMLKRAEELAEKGELEVLALYLWTAHLLREGRFEDAEKFLKKES